MSAPVELNEIETEIKKIRKKLREIANFERKDRHLTYKEKNKVAKKSFLRNRLHELLPNSVTSNLKTTKSKEKSPKKAPQVSVKKNQDVKQAKKKNLPKPREADELETLSAPKDFSNNSSFHQSEPEDDSHEEYDDDNNVTDENISTTEKTEIIVSTPAERSPVNAEACVSPIKGKWRQRECEVNWLEGHNDLVTAVASYDGLMVTASRDTTVKIWQTATGELVRSLGGHSETVTCIHILPEEASQTLGKLLEAKSESSFIITGSTDCTFKIWCLETGDLIKSVYTYNPITSLVYSELTQLLVTASGGGKLELWDISSSANVYTLKSEEEEAITCLCIKHSLLYSSSANGTIKVFELKDKKLSCVFESDNVKTTRGSALTSRYVRSLAVEGEVIYYGDDALNLKAINWKKGLVVKYPNHVNQFASTDAMCVHDDLLITSSFDLDHGLGYLNFRQLPSCEYLFSLNDEETERITSITCTTDSSTGGIIVITGGQQLKTWHILDSSRLTNNELPRTQFTFMEQLSSEGHDSDSDDDEEEEESDEEEDEVDIGLMRSDRYVDLDKETATSRWWCQIL